jgi:hypothetical protein
MIRKSKKKYTPEREKKRVETTKRKYGPDYYHRLGKKYGGMTSTKFDSTTASIAAKKRWEKYRNKKEGGTVEE